MWICEKGGRCVDPCDGCDHYIEVEPVVRCKDCKHSGMYSFGCGDNEKLACLEVEEDGFVRFATAVDANGYCSRGERRADHE